MLGRFLQERFPEERWLQRSGRYRSIIITPSGAASFAHYFGIQIQML
jgi:hypothetical protein